MSADTSLGKQLLLPLLGHQFNDDLGGSLSIFLKSEDCLNMS